MGDRDFVREVLDELGVEQLFWKIDIKPGRPTAFGCAGTPVFSLPGNPVSTLLTFDQFVRPALLRMMGHRDVLQPLVSARLDDMPRDPGASPSCACGSSGATESSSRGAPATRRPGC